MSKARSAAAGLASTPLRLYENRDLAVKTDFRDVFTEILEKHLGIADLKPVFPGGDLARERRLGLIA